MENNFFGKRNFTADTMLAYIVEQQENLLGHLLSQFDVGRIKIKGHNWSIILPGFHCKCLLSETTDNVRPE